MTTLPEPVALQFWSHQEITPEIRAQIEGILSGGERKDKSADNVCVVEDSAPPAQNPNIKQTPQGIWVLVNDSHISRWVEEHGSLYHDKQTLPLVLPEINEGDHVVDVGAHIGDTAGPFLYRVGKSGFVFAIEPNHDAYECLVRNLRQIGTDDNWTAVKYAASDDDLETVGLSSDLNAGAIRVEGNGSIPTAKIDSFNLGRVDFLKIDVEGFELRVLKGAEQTINRFHPKMLIEVNHGALERQGARFSDLSNWLVEHGYTFEIVQKDDANFNSAQFDILCRYSPIEHTAAKSGPDTIQSLAERLKKFCGNSSQTRAVRLELHRQGVIELPYRFKRRKKWRKRRA